MCSRNWRIAMMVPWLAFVAMLLDIWRAYDSLPAVIASHFNAAGVANGFAPKQPVFTTIIGVAFGLLCLFTFILSRFPQISGLGWLVMVAEFWGIGILFGITHGTLRVNLGEAKTLDFPLGIWSLIMGGALLIGEVGRIRVARKRAREYGELIAEETHASPVMGMIFLVIAIGLFAASLLLDLHGPSQTVPVTIKSLVFSEDPRHPHLHYDHHHRGHSHHDDHNHFHHDHNHDEHGHGHKQNRP